MENKQFSALNPEILARWHKSAANLGIPKEAYRPNIRVVQAKDGSYSFGVIHNENRFKRVESTDRSNAISNCNLCDAVKLAQKEQVFNLLPYIRDKSFIVTLNKFPIIEGFSLCISTEEVPTYTTKNLEALQPHLEMLLELTSETGFELFHNSPGFGATIPKHEHWHLTTFRMGYDLAGRKYGFDYADKVSLKGAGGIKVMPEFPFAHLIFDDKDPGRIVSFLSKMHNEIGDRWDNHQIPHTVSMGYEGLLVCIGKQYMEKCRGSGDVAGHYVVRSKEDFERMNYEECVGELDKLLFRKDEINLERFI